MSIHLLIADARYDYRKKLCNLLLNEPFISHIDEADSTEALKDKLLTCSPDIIIVQQPLIRDISILRSFRFIIIAHVPNKRLLTSIKDYHICGYLLEENVMHLLTTALNLNDHECIIDPALTYQMLEDIASLPFSMIIASLTPRERDFFALLRRGFSISDAATRLGIAEGTGRKHAEHIRKKLRMSKMDRYWSDG